MFMPAYDEIQSEGNPSYSCNGPLMVTYGICLQWVAIQKLFQLKYVSHVRV